tara:strand:- start:883 stop:1911 length:1029 start_codon:yes stop_codon:yes gene_type:complete
MNINDCRLQKEFGKITFSKYKKNSVVKELIQCILKNKLESAYYWSAELVCAGHFIVLWDTILTIIGKYIRNPTLPIYILMRFRQFKEIVKNGYIDNELSLRNNLQIRIMFGEICVVLCNAMKNLGFEMIKIKPEEFNITTLTHKFKAPHVYFIKEIFRENDPKEIFIPLNEFAYQIEKNKNFLEGCYWIEWIIEYDSISRKKKDPLVAESRMFAPDKYNKDVIWIIWEIIIKHTNSQLQKRCIESLIELFSLKYSYATKKKRRALLYFAVELLINNKQAYPDILTPKVKQIIHIIQNNLDKIYKKIKQNEIAPKTDYLFHGIEQKSNQEKTAEKLALFNTLI